MMSICLTLVSYKWIRKTQVIPQFGEFYKEVGVTWRVSDFEELVIVTHGGFCEAD